MSDTNEIATGRIFAIVAANCEPDHWERARLLFNLGIRGGTTRAQLDRVPVSELLAGSE